MDNADTSDLFPSRLRQTRVQRDLEQSELSNLSGIASTSISHFEAGRRKPSLVNLRNLADALEVSIDFLLGRTENPSAHIDAAAFRDGRLHSGKDQKLLDDIEKLLIQQRANE